MGAIQVQHAVAKPHEYGRQVKAGAALLVLGIAGVAALCIGLSQLPKFQQLSRGIKTLSVSLLVGGVTAGAIYSGLKVDNRSLAERFLACLDCVEYNFGFEAQHAVKSKRISFNEFCGLMGDEALPELPNGQIMLVNGVNGTTEKVEQRLCNLSTYTQVDGGGPFNVHAVWNATHGVGTDVWEAIGNIQGKATDPSVLLFQAWTEFHQMNMANPDAQILQLCHSQGAAHVRNALVLANKADPEIGKRIRVAAFAPAAYIPQELCASVTHYVTSGDLVPLVDRFGRAYAKSQETVEVVERAPSARKVMDHSMSSKSFTPHIQKEIQDFVRACSSPIKQET